MDVFVGCRQCSILVNRLCCYGVAVMAVGRKRLVSALSALLETDLTGLSWVLVTWLFVSEAELVIYYFILFFEEENKPKFLHIGNPKFSFLFFVKYLVYHFEFFYFISCSLGHDKLLKGN